MVPTRYASESSDPRPYPRGQVRAASVQTWALAVGLVASVGLGCAHASGREVPVGMLEISTETSDADVWVDGEYIGQVAAVSGKLRLAPGVHRVEIRKPGHFPVQRTVRVDRQARGEAVVVEAELLTDPR